MQKLAKNILFQRYEFLKFSKRNRKTKNKTKRQSHCDSNKVLNSNHVKRHTRSLALFSTWISPWVLLKARIKNSVITVFLSKLDHRPHFIYIYILREYILYSPYQARWQIPKLILKACTISFNAFPPISFWLVLISFESYVKYREY